MGQITIEIPQSGNRTFRILSKDRAEKVLQNLEEIEYEEAAIEAEEDEDILGLWTEPEKLVRKRAA